MGKQGFISLHRKLMDNPIWSDPNYLKLWLYCLFQASHKEHEQLVGNQMVKLERGQFITGRFALNEAMSKNVKPKQRLNELTWWRHLSNLEKFEMLNIKTTNKFSVVTIVNYDFYQSVFNKDEHKDEQQLNNKRTTDEQQLNTNNNVNTANNANKKESRPKRVYDKDSECYIIAEFFVSEIRKNYSEFETPNIQQWSDDIRKLIEIDKKDKKRVCEIIRLVQQDPFWFKNCLSPSKLRKQFKDFEIKFLAEGPKTNTKENSHLNQSQYKDVSKEDLIF